MKALNSVSRCGESHRRPRFRSRFDAVVREQFKSAGLPPTATAFDFYYDMKPREKSWKAWQLPEFTYDKDKSFFDLFVPTEDTVKHAVVLQTLFDLGKPCFFTGESGVGKTAVIEALLDQLKDADLQPIGIGHGALPLDEDLIARNGRLRILECGTDPNIRYKWRLG